MGKAPENMESMLGFELALVNLRFDDDILKRGGFGLRVCDNLLFVYH